MCSTLGENLTVLCLVTGGDGLLSRLASLAWLGGGVNSSGFTGGFILVSYRPVKVFTPPGRELSIAASDFGSTVTSTDAGTTTCCVHIVLERMMLTYMALFLYLLKLVVCMYVCTML